MIASRIVNRRTTDRGEKYENKELNEGVEEDDKGVDAAGYCEKQAHHKVSLVLMSYTRVDPGAVMVHPLHATIHTTKLVLQPARNM